MIQNDFNGLKLSALGLGCMRFPILDGDHGKVDIDAVREMLAVAMDGGINYYDTAYGYHNGQSETVMGELLAAYPRDSFYLADKFPGYDRGNFDKYEEIFEEQLKKCRVDYFDFYLCHTVCESNIDLYIEYAPKLKAYLLEQKKNGRIRHLGFSNHGSLETTERFLSAYGDCMEFCQIQLNWLDWTVQNAKAMVDLLRERHLPIWVMEPVRGGKLATLSPEYEQRLRALRPDTTAAEWAFRYLQGFSDVVVTLSGMSNPAQLNENIATYQTAKPLTDDETAALLAVADDMIAQNFLLCTGCRYCTSYCPMELDIPSLIDGYNEYKCFGGFSVPMAIEALPENKRPSACLGCRACEAVCPQTIRISEMMRDFTERLK